MYNLENNKTLQDINGIPKTYHQPFRPYFSYKELSPGFILSDFPPLPLETNESNQFIRVS